jgi:hypothetical protein
MTDWIDFKELKRALSFEAVLRHYGVIVKRGKGNHHQGNCPLPGHQGPRKRPSFSAKLDHGVFRCFSCGASGDAIRFATLMEGLNPDNNRDLRSVAIKLRDLFQIGPGRQPQRERPAPAKAAAAQKSAAMPVLVNPPLDFELKNIDPKHPSLTGRGLYPETIERFGLGYCNRGYFAGRIAIPLHADGKLIGYAGELVRDDANSPSLLYPEDRERDGRRIRFDRTLLVYNLSRLKTPLTDLIVVTDLASVWWLTQCGYPQVVSLMGPLCSDEQAKFVSRSLIPDGRFWLFADGAERGVPAILAKLAPQRFVRWVKADGSPTIYTPGDMSRMLWSV